MLSQDPTKKYDQQRGGGMSLAGAGETYLQKASRIINGQISKTKKELDQLKKHRKIVKDGRLRREEMPPHVAVIGYTNAGMYKFSSWLLHDL